MFKHHLWKVIVAVALAATLVTPGVSATSTVFQSPGPVPPPNDNFYSATVITSLPFNDSVDLTYATTQENEPQPCNWSPQTAWYVFTPSADGAYKIDLSGFYDGNLAVYQAYGSDITNLNYLKCDSWEDPSISIIFNGYAGNTYYIQIGKIWGGIGTANLSVQQLLPPPNDNFADATVISGTPYSQTVNVAAATTETGEPQGCCETPQHTVWYAFTPLENGAVTVSLWGNDSMNTIVNAYQANGPGLGGLSSSLGEARYGGGFSLSVQSNQTYYFQAGTIWSWGNELYFSLSFTPAPANDNFANTKVITTLPYDDNTDMIGASREDGEPTPSCGSMSKTIWYAYTPTESGSLSQNPSWSGSWDTMAAVYTGSSLGALQEVGCRYHSWYDNSYLTFHVDAGTTYYFQVGTNDNISVPFHLQVAEQPVANFSLNPSDPNVFDTITFNNQSWDPAQTNLDLMTRIWDFGDGTTLTVIPPTNEPWSPTHRYAKDGDYTVKLTVITIDGRTASMTQTVQVRTRDVAITKFSAPQSASVNQTRQIVVGINSKRYVDVVEVVLFKSVPATQGEWQWVGTLQQTVPVRSSNRTTEFTFNYTFTKDDATIGKVTFKAIATIVNARDALPADNEAISSPTKVGKK